MYHIVLTTIFTTNLTGSDCIGSRHRSWRWSWLWTHFCRTAWPVHPFGWDLKDQWRAYRGSDTAAVLDRWASISSCIGGTFARSRSKSTGGICSRLAHVCLSINRWYMTVLRTFRKCSILQRIFVEPVGNFQKPVKTFQDALFLRQSY